MTLPTKPHRGESVRAELIGQMIDYMRMATPVPGPNIKVHHLPGGSVIEGTPGGAAAAYSGLEPWTIRKHATADDPDGQWEIWLPPGCMSVGVPLRNLNRAASESSGHDEDEDGWRLLHIDEDEGAPTFDRDEGTVHVSGRSWDVVAHAKTAGRLDGVDAINEPAVPYLYVSARKNTGEGETVSEKDRIGDTQGDEFSQTVGVVEIGTRSKDGEERPYAKVERIAHTPVSVAGRPRTGFDLEWTYDVLADGTLEVAHVYCVRQLASAAGLTLEGPDMTEVTGAEENVYAMIRTNPLDPTGTGAVEVVKDAQGRVVRDNWVTWLRLYDMAYDAVIIDYRAQSLVNLQVYR